LKKEKKIEEKKGRVLNEIGIPVAPKEGEKTNNYLQSQDTNPVQA